MVRTLEKNHMPGWAKAVIAVRAVSVEVIVIAFVGCRHTHPNS
jgi:hypothetical protein